MRVAGHLLLAAAVWAQAAGASAQDVWHAAVTQPCAGGIRASHTGLVVACHGELSGTRFVGGPNDALGRAGAGWVGETDDGSTDGLAAYALAPDGVGWTRTSHVPTGTVVGAAVPTDRTRVTTVELRARGARAEVWLVERAVPSLATLRQVRLPGAGPLDAVDVRYVLGGVAVALPGRVVVVSPRGAVRTVLEAPHAVTGLAPNGGRAVSVSPLPGDALEVRVVAVGSGAVESTFELTGGGVTDVVVADDASRLVLLDDDGIRMVTRPSNDVAVLARRDDAVTRLAWLGDALLAWRGPTAEGAASLTRWERGPAHRPASAGAPRIDPTALAGFTTHVPGAAQAPLRALDAASRPLVWTKLVVATTADEPTATLDLQLVPAALVPDDGDAAAWARAVAALLGPANVDTVHVVGDHVMELEGWDDGGDPPAAWVRVERRGAWLVRTELSVVGGDDEGARTDAWRETLRHAVAP